MLDDHRNSLRLLAQAGLSRITCARRGALLSGRTASCVTQEIRPCPVLSAARATVWSTAPAVSSFLSSSKELYAA